MTIFFDDFERANGAPGGNWVNAAGSLSITSGYLAGSTGSAGYDTTVSSTGRNETVINCGYNGSSSLQQAAGVKIGTGGANGYYCYISYSAPDYTFHLCKGTPGVPTSLASTGIGTSMPFGYSLRLVYDQGHLTATFNGSTTIEADDLQYVAGTYCGVYAGTTSARIADFKAISDSAVDFTIDPDVVGNYGEAVTLTATGTGTAWSSGTPGTPTFTCDHGTITAQTVASATSATLTYDPGNYLGAVIFTDPSTGETAIIIVTSDPTLIPPDGSWLSQAAIDYIERSAIAETNPTILNRDTVVGDGGETASAEIALGELRLSAYKSTWTVEGDPSTAALLYTLWRLVNGQAAPPVGPYPSPNFDSIDAGLGLIKGDLDALMGESEWTLPDLLGYLGGDPFASHRDIITALGNVGFDDSAILQAIADMQGDPLATIKAVLDYLFALRTVNEYTLGDVKTWVEAARGSGLPTIKDVADRLALIQPTTTNSLDDILSKVVGQTTLQSIIDLAVLAIAGTEGATIAAVLDGISGLADLLNGLTVSVKAPPVWPGIDGVTLGDAVALASQLTIDEPMDGCLVDVTGVDGGVAFYTYGGVKAYRNVGALCFLTDQGDLEDWQLLGREHAIYTPRTMIRAAGLKLFTGHGLAGSVTPWTVNA